MTDATEPLSLSPAAVSTGWRTADVLPLLARLLLGVLFIYMGLNKALHPVEFLKLLRQYDVLIRLPHHVAQMRRYLDSLDSPSRRGFARGRLN